MIKLIANKHKREISCVSDAVFDCENLAGDAYVEVIFCDDAYITDVNLRMRSIASATDVLSFPTLDFTRFNGVYPPFSQEHFPFDYDEKRKAVSLGSILINENAVSRQAEEYGHSVSRERLYLFVHGLLHLLGYDHERDEDKAVMREKEECALKCAGAERV